MAINSLSELSGGTGMTDAQIHRLLDKINTKLLNLTYPTGDAELDIMAGVDYEEHGDVGHKMEPTALINALLRWQESLMKALEDPAMRGDVLLEISQWDNPDL